MNRIHAIAAATAVFSLTLCTSAGAAISKAEYNAAKDRAAGDYKVAIAQCKSLASNPKDICEAQAKANQKKAEAMAEADYKSTPQARADAMEASADADYDLAKTKCDTRTGNDKDVCVKEAKAAQTRAKADAKAQEKSTVARRDAADDTRDADYKVAMEKCDGFAGDAKTSCQRNAKAAYGK
jgi:hypothetical protein